MDFGLGDLASIGLAASGGGIIGIAGFALRGLFSWLNTRQQIRLEEMRHANEVELHRLQIEARAHETEQEIALASERGRWAGLTESIQADRATSKNESQWVTNIKSLTRPFLTVLSLFLGNLLFFVVLFGGLNEFVGIEARETLILYAVFSGFYYPQIALTWWFGDRPGSPPRLMQTLPEQVRAGSS